MLSFSTSVLEDPGSRRYVSVFITLKAENPVCKLKVFYDSIELDYGFLSRHYHRKPTQKVNFKVRWMCKGNPSTPGKLKAFHEEI